MRRIHLSDLIVIFALGCAFVEVGGFYANRGGGDYFGEEREKMEAGLNGPPSM
jgi:hypothetical protein